MAKKKVKNRLQIVHRYVTQEPDYEHNSGKSETIPDESYTIPELLRRFTAGQQIPENEGFYFNEGDASHEDFDLQEVQRMDPVDKQQINDQLQNTIDSINKDMEAASPSLGEAEDQRAGHPEGISQSAEEVGAGNGDTNEKPS